MAYSFNSPGKTWDRVCPRCGKEFSADCASAKYCPDCRDAHKAEADKERTRALYEERKARSECIYCGYQDERTRSGFVACTTCAEKKRVSQAGTRKRRKTKGLCLSCGRPVDDGYATCKACRDNIKDYYITRINHKVCTRCGKSDDLTKAGKAICKECAADQSTYQANKYNLRTVNRMCPDCGRPLPSGWYFTYCPEHAEINRARRRARVMARKAAKDEGAQEEG